MKRVLPRLIATIVLLICGVAIAAPAQAASLPVLYASSTNDNFAHVCQDYAQPGMVGYDLITICADITTGTYTSSDGPAYFAQAQIEVTCLDTGTVVPCSSVAVLGGLYRQSNTSWTGQSASCNGNCAGSGQRNYFTLNRLTYLDSTWKTTCTDDVNGYTADWTVVQSVSVVFPGGEAWTVIPGPATAHNFICQ